MSAVFMPVALGALSVSCERLGFMLTSANAGLVRLSFHELNITVLPSCPTGVVFETARNYRHWLQAWLKHLVAAAGGPLVPAYEAVRSVAIYDTALATFLLPHLVLEVVGQGGQAKERVKDEIVAVMQV
jgi:hypothetical protein